MHILPIQKWNVFLKKLITSDMSTHMKISTMSLIGIVLAKGSLIDGEISYSSIP